MIFSVNYRSDHAREIWRSCLISAFRTALACTIVGCFTLFGPSSFKHQVAFPAFSYVTVILVVTDATLGDTFRGCWNAVQASVLAVCPAFLSLWLIGPARLTASSTAVAVAISAFAVVLPENTRLVSKRIALGQIVLVYVLGYINGRRTEPIMHPVHVLASTAVGVVACVLALLFPYPGLACFEVNKNCQLFTENASERLNLFVKAFSAEDNSSALGYILQAKSLAMAGTKLLRSIKSKQESMQWERYPVKFLQSYCKNPGQKLQELETPLRGMEIALSSSPSFPIRLINSELIEALDNIESHITDQVQTFPHASATVPESNSKNIGNSLKTFQSIQLDFKDLPSLFFLFCLQLLQKNCSPNSPIDSTKEDEQANSEKKEEWFLKKFVKKLALPVNINSKRLMPAIKCSLSLGLAVFFGSIYSKENGYWAGLPVAVSLAPSREATFKVTNIKAQGTVLGTVYGVLGCFVFERYVQIRFISLIPWFLFCSFLRGSKMYGQAGGISAVIGAVLILGRKNFGPTSEFAIERIIETFIGLSCSLVVEILLQPTRASALSKIQLSESLERLHNCVNSISLSSNNNNKSQLEESLKNLKFQVSELGKSIGEAEVEPNFWFLPFHGACYGKLLGSLSKVVEFLLFITQATEFLEQQFVGRIPKDIVKKLESDLKVPKDMICSSIKCFEEVNLIKSIAILDKEFEKRKDSLDLELGKSSITIKSDGGLDEDEIKKNMDLYIQHSKELIDGIENEKFEEDMKNQMVLSLSCLAYCMNGLVKETKEIERAIKELVQWENPSSHVNLHAISCKIRALADTNNNSK